MQLLFSTLTNKALGMCKGASNQSPDRPKKLYRAGTAPLGSKIPGSATCEQQI